MSLPPGLLMLSFWLQLLSDHFRLLASPLSQAVQFLMFRFTFLFFKVISFVCVYTCMHHTVIHVEA